MTNNYGGVARYFCELVNGLNNDKNVVSKINLLISNNPEILSTKTIYHLNILPNINFKGYYRVINYINKLYTISKLKNKDYDIFHPTYYDPYFLEYLDNVPYVLTVYDMIHEKFQDTVNDAKEISLKKKLSLDSLVDFIDYTEKIDDFIYEADIGILPSRWEGFGLVAVEMLSSGLPIIISDTSGLGDIFSQYNGVVTFQNGSLNSLKISLNKIIDELKENKFKVNDINDELKEYDENNFISKYNHFYQKL